MYALFGNTQMMVGYDDDTIDDVFFDNRSNSYLRAPSAEEFASKNGIQFDPTDTQGNIGKILTQEDIDNEDDIQGSSGFLWGF